MENKDGAIRLAEQGLTRELDVSKLEAILQNVEKESGPVELTVSLELKGANGDSEAIDMVVGSLDERSLKVNKIEGVDKNYEHDVAFMTGDYNNLTGLSERLDSMNFFYRTDPISFKPITDSVKSRMDKISANQGFKIAKESFGPIKWALIGIYKGVSYGIDKGLKVSERFGKLKTQIHESPTTKVIKYIFSLPRDTSWAILDWLEVPYLRQEYVMDRTGIYAKTGKADSDKVKVAEFGFDFYQPIEKQEEPAQKAN
jgi:hypothetical protein